jgi:hypothetical protein
MHSVYSSCILLWGYLATSTMAFSVVTPPTTLSLSTTLPATWKHHRRTFLSLNSQSNDNNDDDDMQSNNNTGETMPTLTRVPVEWEGKPIPFVDTQANAFIECYADSLATVNGREYTIGVPCDYAVALCRLEKSVEDNDDDDVEGELLPIELDDPFMDELFPVAAEVAEEEFGEDLVLQRTPQTLTMVGELDDEDDSEEDDSEDDDDDEEEVEVLLSFDYKDEEYCLVRMLDPILLVGKPDPNNPNNRILLTTEESETIMPIIEDMFVDYSDDMGNGDAGYEISDASEGPKHS